MTLAALAHSFDDRCELLLAKTRVNAANRLADRPRALTSLCESALDGVLESLKVGDVVDVVAWSENGIAEHPAEVLDAVLSSACSAVASEAYRLEGRERELIEFLETARAEVSFALSSGRFESRREDEHAAEIRAAAIEGLIAGLAARDAETAVHSRAVAIWSRRIAEALGYEASVVAEIETVGLLHDVGKIATPDEVLRKEGSLTNDEWAKMKEHPVQGDEMLRSIPALAGYAPGVRSHHERVDGCGYPDRLVGEAIPLAARIVAVADSFHAMVSKRCYRDSLSPKAALEILRDGRGTQWDGRVVDAMLSLFTGKSVEPARVSLFERKSA